MQKLAPLSAEILFFLKLKNDEILKKRFYRKKISSGRNIVLRSNCSEHRLYNDYKKWHAKIYMASFNNQAIMALRLGPYFQKQLAPIFLSGTVVYLGFASVKSNSLLQILSQNFSSQGTLTYYLVFFLLLQMGFGGFNSF